MIISYVMIGLHSAKAEILLPSRHNQTICQAATKIILSLAAAWIAGGKKRKLHEPDCQVFALSRAEAFEGQHSRRTMAQSIDWDPPHVSARPAALQTHSQRPTLPVMSGPFPRPGSAVDALAWQDSVSP